MRQHFAHRLVERVDDRLRRRGRRAQAVPGQHLVAGHAGFGDRRHVRQEGRALGAGGRERPQLLVDEDRVHGRIEVGHQLDVVADECRRSHRAWSCTE